MTQPQVRQDQALHLQNEEFPKPPPLRRPDFIEKIHKKKLEPVMTSGRAIVFNSAALPLRGENCKHSGPIGPLLDTGPSEAFSREGGYFSPGQAIYYSSSSSYAFASQMIRFRFLEHQQYREGATGGIDSK